MFKRGRECIIADLFFSLIAIVQSTATEPMLNSKVVYFTLDWKRWIDGHIDIAIPRVWLLQQILHLALIVSVVDIALFDG